MKKNDVKSVIRTCSGVCTIQLREKAIVESPAFDLAASADLSTSGCLNLIHYAGAYIPIKVVGT